MEERIHFLQETGSTSDDAREMARQGTSLPFTVVARSQTRGRGRSGNTWLSPKGGLYMSHAVPMDPTLRHLYGPACAVTVRRVLSEHYGLGVLFKWPNDFLVEGRKLGGQLLEAFQVSAGPSGVPYQTYAGEKSGGWVLIIGIGINCSVVPGPLPAGSFEPTSMARELGHDVNPEELACLIAENLNNFSWLYAKTTEVVRDYCRHLDTLGRQVRVTLPDGRTIRGTAVDLEEDFSLVVDTPAERVRVTAGDLVHVRDA